MTPTTFLEKTRNEELHLILLPAELVPDLEAQIVNQIGDLLSQERAKGREEAVDYLLSKFTTDAISVRHPENMKIWDAARTDLPTK